MVARNSRCSLALVAVGLVALSVGAAMAAPQIQTHTLANGMEVYVVENRGAPLVTIEVAVKGGASVETPDLSGVSHFHEHMMMRKNQVLPTAEAFLARRRELGLDGNAWAGIDRVAFNTITTREHLEKAMVFMRDVFCLPASIGRTSSARRGRFWEKWIVTSPIRRTSCWIGSIGGCGGSIRAERCHSVPATVFARQHWPSSARSSSGTTFQTMLCSWSLATFRLRPCSRSPRRFMERGSAVQIRSSASPSSNIHRFAQPRSSWSSTRFRT